MKIVNITTTQQRTAGVGGLEQKFRRTGEKKNSQPKKQGKPAAGDFLEGNAGGAKRCNFPTNVREEGRFAK